MRAARAGLPVHMKDQVLPLSTVVTHDEVLSDGVTLLNYDLKQLLRLL